MTGGVFSLQPNGPFRLRSANEYFGGWVDAANGPDFVVPMAFPVESWTTSAAVFVRQSADGTVSGDVCGADGQEDAAWKQALAVLSLDVDGTGFPDVGRRDPVIGDLQERYAGLRPVLFNSPYESAAAFVIGHRISIAQGRVIRTRLAAQHGQPIDTPRGTLHAFPSPEGLLRLDAFPGIPAAKWPRLHGVARAALDGLLDRTHLRQTPHDEALRRIRTIPGLGEFFSQGVLLRGAGLVDAVSDDVVSKQAVERAYGLDHTPAHDEVLEIARAWEPFRMWALVLLHVWLRREAGLRAPGVAQRRHKSATGTGS
jgi:DNA-3-methyladenine glycosylase II